MKFQVSLTAAAKRNVRVNLRWIEARSRSGAEAWYRRWLQVLDELRDRADTFGPAPEDVDHAETIRQIIFNTRRGLPYRALFVVRDRDVFVLHVRGPGQDLLSADDVEFPD